MGAKEVLEYLDPRAGCLPRLSLDRVVVLLRREVEAVDVAVDEHNSVLRPQTEAIRAI